MNDYKDVMIYGEIVEGRLGTVTKELLGCGKRLATKLGEALCAVIVGSNVRHLCEEAIAFGADRVYAVDNPLLEDYQTELYTLSLAEIIQQTTPRLFIMGNTAVGQDLSPRLAFRLETATVLDCVELDIHPESRLLVQTKPVYGGKALAAFLCKTFPQMATIRPKSMPPAERDASRKGEIIDISLDIDLWPVKSKLLERATEKVEGITLEDAEVVIAGGRGIGGSEGFKQLDEMAKILKGALAATRAACDEGWVPTTMQVGLTGKIIAPKVYIAVALSGSSQHMAGCSGSGTIVAINKDERANIFKEAKFGVVGDWKVMLPNLVKTIEEL